MLRELLLTLVWAGAAYIWLCAVAAPVIGSIRSLVRRAGFDAWRALALAAAGAVLWTAIGAAALLLLITLEPRAYFSVLETDALWPRLLLGTAVWGSQWTLTSRIPRIGADFEAATAVAIVSLVRDDAGTLERVARFYTARAIDPAGSMAAASAPRYGVAG
jgi:hypothetical protein